METPKEVQRIISTLCIVHIKIKNPLAASKTETFNYKMILFGLDRINKRLTVTIFQLNKAETRIQNIQKEMEIK